MFLQYIFTVEYIHITRQRIGDWSAACLKRHEQPSSLRLGLRHGSRSLKTMRWLLKWSMSFTAVGHTVEPLNPEKLKQPAVLGLQLTC